MDFSNFHFLRPTWLLLALLGLLLPLIWQRSRDLQRRLRGNIAPHLLPHLLLTPNDPHRVRPVHLVCALLVLGAIATAGPTWQQDRPDFLENRAPLIIAVDLSPSMDTADVPPTRLTAAKHTLHDLVQRRKGTRTALLVYAGSAHLVLPPTDDPELLDTFIQALGTDLISKSGKDVAAVIEQAKRLLQQSPGTLLLVTDGADVAQLPTLKDDSLQVLVLALGSSPTLKQLASALDAPLGSLTLNDDDLDWVARHAQQHFQNADEQQRLLQWKDAGYWLCWPLLLLALVSVRRGWSLNWGAVLLLGLLLPPTPAEANPFLTLDQQGRWAFEHHHYPEAAARFVDPYWKGIAAYNAADYDLAQTTFSAMNTPQAAFYLGNIHVRRFKFDDAISAYQHALQLQPDFPEASANLALAIALKKDTESAANNTPEVKPDEVKFDKAPGKGQSKAIQTQQANNDALWLQNLTTSPANFLRRKFSLQDQEAKP
ncbi:VWA domain-containing protein [Pseudomonas sp. WS 5106]|uniref:VWA domain-containing protein n=1 Tax=Pseudomonas cremoris TaxID=2724178 RepID=A0A7X1AP49_9PSED|nr:VWA domain-containing protein [Pseudomonas cremoris]MBC2380935.1 VWA domain-containing protein [Pseudomonas cremoris]MBC2408163.1 VWA domain-containing protein [Pseudomonas cremoris]